MFTIAASALTDILFIGYVLNTKIAYTTAEKLTVEAFLIDLQMLQDGNPRTRRNKRELVDARPPNAARCCYKTNVTKRDLVVGNT